MEKSIIDKAKAEVKAKREPKTIKVKSLVCFITTVIITLAIGAFAGITINNAINDNINNQVKTQVDAQSKTSE